MVVTIAPLDLRARAADAAAVQSVALGPVSPDRVAVYARHTVHPGFRAFGAFDTSDGEDKLVGFAYGAACRSGQWWFDQISPSLRAAGYGPWIADAYAVTELHVRPEYHGQGLGLTLLTTLLSGVGNPTALLSTYDGETRARRLYRGLGFVDLITGFRFGTSSQGYALMAAPLPLAVRQADPARSA
ncbi:GNAT family N-acetyltransferase [Sporichthya brevicatena]|uniref:GNAT family N-acetyltransferase n=1 Tax=Sporichthya brevicatena TaxID=171442 RepID=A0ABP3SBQ9_9ACTN